MSKTSLEDLRGHMFDVIERLIEGNDPEADPKDSIDIDRAKAVAVVADKVIKSAKIEVDAMKIVHNHCTNFDPVKHMQDVGIISEVQKKLGE